MPCPNIHTVLSSYAPPSAENAYLVQLSVAEVTMSVGGRDHHVWRFLLIYQGVMVPMDVGAVATVETKRTILFLDWSQTACRCGINYQPRKVVPEETWRNCSGPCASRTQSSFKKARFASHRISFNVDGRDFLIPQNAVSFARASHTSCSRRSVFPP